MNSTVCDNPNKCKTYKESIDVLTKIIALKDKKIEELEKVVKEKDKHIIRIIHRKAEALDEIQKLVKKYSI